MVTLLGREISAANGKAQASTQGALLFFPFEFGVGRIFFHVSLGSQYVLTVFLVSSQWELSSMFPKFLMYSPTCSP
jgi:hypothetical protein